MKEIGREEAKRKTDLGTKWKTSGASLLLLPAAASMKLETAKQ